MNIKLATSILLSLLVTNCGSVNNDSALTGETNSRGSDITILQSWISQDAAAIKTNGQSDRIIGAEYKLDHRFCSEVSSHSSNSSEGPTSYVTADCASELADKAKLSGHRKTSPVLGSALHTYQIMHHTGRIYLRSAKCETVEFRTVIRNSALQADSFSGVGFYYSANDVNPIFVSKNRLHKVGSVTLKDGSPATVHRFVAQGMCFGLGGNGGSIYRRQYKFRPFAQFQAGDETYRVWDNVRDDYLLGRNRDNGTFTQTFDRQNELLAQ